MIVFRDTNTIRKLLFMVTSSVDQFKFISVFVIIIIIEIKIGDTVTIGDL